MPSTRKYTLNAPASTMPYSGWAWADGNKVKFLVPPGFWDGSQPFVVADYIFPPLATDLTANNLRKGKTAFGVSGAFSQWRVSISPLANDGQYQLQADGNSYQGIVWNADAAGIKAALNYGSYQGNVDVVYESPGNYIVTFYYPVTEFIATNQAGMRSSVSLTLTKTQDWVDAISARDQIDQLVGDPNVYEGYCTSYWGGGSGCAFNWNETGNSFQSLVSSAGYGSCSVTGNDGLPGGTWAIEWTNPISQPAPTFYQSLSGGSFTYNSAYYQTAITPVDAVPQLWSLTPSTGAGFGSFELRQNGSLVALWDFDVDPYQVGQSLQPYLGVEVNGTGGFVSSGALYFTVHGNCTTFGSVYTLVNRSLFPSAPVTVTEI